MGNRKFYAVTEHFSNVEDIFSFETKKERDEFVANEDYKTFAISHKELIKRLAMNRRIVRQNKRIDSGWVNGLPEYTSEIQER